uniref:Uncharacterized protein n=1 Tax=Vitis vinifera TaxID=29760 RepID=F6HEN4_VITVI
MVMPQLLCLVLRLKHSRAITSGIGRSPAFSLPTIYTPWLMLSPLLCFLQILSSMIQLYMALFGCAQATLCSASSSMPRLMAQKAASLR